MNYLKNLMMKMAKIKKLITHDGSFHSDDIFAAATLILYLEKTNNNFSPQGGPASGWEIIRTRDPEIIKTGDYVFDVGGVHDPETNRFDHHQVGGAGKRAFGNVQIEYAAFGLVWKKFGAEVSGSKKVADFIDQRLVAPIDAADNGFNLIENKYDVSPYFIQNAFSSMQPTWNEADLTENEMFLKSVEIAKLILSREIIYAQDAILAEERMTLIYKNTEDKKIIVLDKAYSLGNPLGNFPEPLFIISPSRSIENKWSAKAVRNDSNTFVNRKNFPASWAGLKDEDLQNVSGVADAVFCHRGLFLAVAKSKEGAIKLAQIAVELQE